MPKFHLGATLCKRQYPPAVTPPQFPAPQYPGSATLVSKYRKRLSKHRGWGKEKNQFILKAWLQGPPSPEIQRVFLFLTAEFKAW